ncbi:hypothetical protein RB195_018418 [Necator americanus]|uniref:Reverse transcriptase domain-containing protein n=1 Tax=Necator americanus TaxID=51031 RepID=A0ABR1C9R6_NECAM
MLLRGLGACAERASKPRTTNVDRISKTTEELLERRRLDLNASHIERQKKILEAAQKRTSLKKCRSDLREYNIPLATLLSEDGTRTSSRREMEIITERTLDEAQPQEQAGFRQRFSCLDHIQTVSRVIEACRGYRLPLVLTFVDYEKAFDSVETNAILSALVDQVVNSSYVRTLANYYDRCTTKIQLFHYSLTIPIGKGVRQGGIISPKLFTAALQWIMKSLSWGKKGHTC